MARERKNGYIAKEEPKTLFEDENICVILKGPGWIVSVSRNTAQNKVLASILRTRGFEDVKSLVQSGKCEHLCHFVILKFKDNKGFHTAEDTNCEFGIAHRLDVDTSGALMLGKTEAGFVHLRNAFTTHTVMKEYLCLVHGTVKQRKGEVDLPIAWCEASNTSYISERGYWARSLYTTLGYYRLKGGKNVFSLCRIVIITGRTHQIRIHMSAIGHPLVSDPKYNSRTASTDSMWCPRIFLHAWRLGFPDINHEYHEVNAPLAADLAKSLRTLEEVKIDVANADNPSCRILANDVADKILDKRAKRMVAGKENLLPVLPSAPQPQPAQFELKPAPPPPKLPAVASGYFPGQRSPWQPLPSPGGSVGDNELALSQARALVTLSNGRIMEARALVTLSNGRIMEAPPKAAPPPPPPPLPAARQDGGKAIQVPPPPPPKQYALPPAPVCEAPLPLANAALDPPPVAASSPTAAKASAKKLLQQQQQQQLLQTQLQPAQLQRLEERICRLVVDALINASKCLSPVGLLGNRPEVLHMLQQMGPKRPKLSKLLRDRPETFILVGGEKTEIVATLTRTAMTRAREYQQSRLKSVTDASAAEAAQRASFRKERLDQEDSLRSELAKLEGQQEVSRRSAWREAVGLRTQENLRLRDENLLLLVEMGFGRGAALRALRANNHDLYEAMDQLSMSAVREESAGQEPAHDVDEENHMHKVLQLSKREEEERRKKARMEDEALQAAIAASQNHPGDVVDADLEAAIAASEALEKKEPPSTETDPQLLAALEESREQQRREQVEEEELDSVLSESARAYELFHGATDDQALEEILRQTLFESQGQQAGASSSSDSGPGDAEQDAEQERLLQEAIQNSYNDAAYDDDDEDDEVLSLRPYMNGVGEGTGDKAAHDSVLGEGANSATSSAHLWLQQASEAKVQSAGSTSSSSPTPATAGPASSGSSWIGDAPSQISTAESSASRASSSLAPLPPSAAEEAMWVCPKCDEPNKLLREQCNSQAREGLSEEARSLSVAPPARPLEETPQGDHAASECSCATAPEMLDEFEDGLAAAAVERLDALVAASAVESLVAAAEPLAAAGEKPLQAPAEALEEQAPAEAEVSDEEDAELKAAMTASLREQVPPATSGADAAVVSIDAEERALEAALAASMREQVTQQQQAQTATSGYGASERSIDAEERALEAALAASMREQAMQQQQAQPAISGDGAAERSIDAEERALEAALAASMREQERFGADGSGHLEAWLAARIGELSIEIDGEVLCTVLGEIPESELGDEEVLKMWLGFGPNEAVPTNLKMLVCEFKQQRIMLRTTGRILG